MCVQGLATHLPGQNAAFSGLKNQVQVCLPLRRVGIASSPMAEAFRLAAGKR